MATVALDVADAQEEPPTEPQPQSMKRGRKVAVAAAAHVDQPATKSKAQEVALKFM